MKAKSWNCKICKEPVSELGAYVKVALGWYEHLTCHDIMQMDFARNQGRNQLMQEINTEKRQRMEQETREITQARERAEAERRMEVAERERTNRILAAQKIPMPAKIEPTPKKEEKSGQQEERPDRFKLIDLE